MTIFVSGGAKNGKSTLAQQLALALAKGGPRFYLATMIPADGEDILRIRRHREDRAGMGFQTLERGRNILSCLTEENRSGTFLLDSVTALLMNELFPDPVTWEPDRGAGDRCARELTEFARSVGNAVFVSDYIFGDEPEYDSTTELFRRSLAGIDRALAAACGTVVEVTAGNVVIHKGVLPV